jgi:hypothetical protein
LRFYRWLEGVDVYTAEAVHLPGTPGAVNRGAVLVPDSLSGYTVFNPGGTAVVLRIPAISAAMATQTFSKRQARGGEGWGVAISGTTRRGTQTNTVVCGYEPDQGDGSRYFPAPPSFAATRIRVYDEKERLYHGYSTWSAFEEGGGTHFVIQFINESGRGDTVVWHAAFCPPLPDGFKARFLNPSTGGWEDASGGLTMPLAAGGAAFRVLAVGGEAYLDTYRKKAFLAGVVLQKAVPNPFTGSLRIGYTVPFLDVQSCAFEIFDMQGRKVCDMAVERPAPGRAQVVWDTASRGHIAAGVYLLRMTVAYGRSAGRSRQIVEQRVTHVP